MKGFYTALALLLIFNSCKESGVPIAKPSTFVRYFNGGFPDQSENIIETADKGFLILANTLTNTTLSNTYYKIKLIKTDAYGNLVWEKFFPEFPKDGATAVPSYRGFGLSAIQDNTGAETGYVIVGDQINGITSHSLLMLQVDKNGSAINSTPKTFNLGSINIQGVGVAQAKNTSGDFFVLGQVQSGTKDMFFAQIDKATLDTVWTKGFGAGACTLANRLFLDVTEQSAYWGGTNKRAGASNSEIRLVQSGFNSQIVGFDLNYGDLSYNLTGADLCPYGYGYAVVGSHSALSSNLYDSIVFTRVSTDGTQLSGSGRSFPLLFSQSVQPANSICSTGDGGLLLLGTVALDAQGTDTDYYLIKIDAFGKQIWAKRQGGTFKDQGVRVLQASDGGYVVLGTTNLANVESIFLMKTDQQGEIQ